MLFPLTKFPTWLPWMVLAGIAIYLAKTQPMVQTIYYPDTITAPNQLDAYLSTASAQYPYSFPGAITIPGGNSWV
jgi:hypothetical protein